MNVLQRISRSIIKFSFNLSVSAIVRFSKMDKYYKQVEDLRKLENGTLGKEIALCLDNHNLDLVPKYESHDLKHVLLNFKMTAEDEIRMQAFMIGNGNHSFPSFAIFGFGAFLLPELWTQFYIDFKNGRKTVPVSDWTIEKYAHHKLQDLRAELPKPIIQTIYYTDMKKFTQIAAFTTVLAGVFGMIYCLPFLFSSNIADLIGAGFPFVGGAILVVGGLFTLSNIIQGNVQNQKTSSAIVNTELRS